MTARAARLTPPGIGGVATIAVVDDAAWPILRELFRTVNDRVLSEPPQAGTLTFGRFGEPPGDEVVLAARPDMPEPWFEIHCHGGRVLVDWILEQLAARGAIIVPWTELVHLERHPREPEAQARDESSLACASGSQNNHRDTWVCAAAAEELTRALTAKTAAILLDQYHGALENEVREIIGIIEANGPSAGEVPLRELSLRNSFGKLTTPWRVAIYGTTNAGKSSLINALAGFERAIVSTVPGTTRDAVSTIVAFDGWPVQLIDTAGLHDTNDPLDRVAIESAQKAIERADMRVWVMDRSQVPVYPPPGTDLVIVNKCDLPTAWTVENLAFCHVCCSALTGEGIDAIGRALLRKFLDDAPLIPGAGVPFDHTIHPIMEALKCCGRGDSDGAIAQLRLLLQPEPPELKTVSS